MTRRPRLAAAVASASALAVLLALLHAWRDLDYWNYSEGVYALTSRLLLAGDDLYGDVVVAQPPLMFLVGGAALALEDSILWLRLAVGGLQALTAALAAYAVWRLTGKGLAAAAAAALAMLTPWAVHEHGLLTPELVGAPLLVGGALLAARTGLAPAAGLVLSLAVFAKLPFALPALLVAVAAADRRRCLCWLAGAMLAQGAVWTAIFGPAMWEAVVVAQQGTGLRTLKQVAEYGSQALWNLLGLLLPAIAALFVLHRRASDADLLRTLPYALLLLWPSLRAIPPEYLDAAALDGYGEWGRIRRVALPLTRDAMIAAWGVAFVLALGELPATNLVYPPGVMPLSVLIWSLLHSGVESHLAGVALVMLAVVAAAGLPTAWALRRLESPG